MTGIDHLRIPENEAKLGSAFKTSQKNDQGKFGFEKSVELNTTKSKDQDLGFSSAINISGAKKKSLNRKDKKSAAEDDQTSQGFDAAIFSEISCSSLSFTESRHPKDDAKMGLKKTNPFEGRGESPQRSPSPERASPSKGGYHLRKRSPFMGHQKMPEILKQDPYAYKYSPQTNVNVTLKIDKETFTRTRITEGNHVNKDSGLHFSGEERVMSFVMLSESLGFYSSNKGSFKIMFKENERTIEEELLSGKVFVPT